MATAAAFVSRVLGPLADDDDVTSRLATTLAAYLRENLSRTRAAACLHIHPNTVSYRVRQAEELLGREVSGDSLDLQVALALLPALGRLRYEDPAVRPPGHCAIAASIRASAALRA